MTQERLKAITAALASPTRDALRGERALEFEGYLRELVGACAELLAENARLRGERSQRYDDAIRAAICRTRHRIEGNTVVFFHDGSSEGTALGQLCDRLVEELLAAETPE